MSANVALSDTFDQWRVKTNELLVMTQVDGSSNFLKLTNATDSTSNTTGSVITAGGVGVAKSVTIGENLNVHGNIHANGNISADGTLTLGSDNTDSINLNADIDSDIIPNIDSTYNLGNTTYYWANLFINTIDVQQESAAGQPGLKVTGADADAKLVEILGSQTTNDILYVNAASLTTGSAFVVNQDLNDDTTRTLAKVVQDNTGATGTTGLTIQMDAGRGIFIDTNLADGGYSLEIDASQTTTNTAKITSAATSASVLEILADSATTGTGISMSMDGLTSGKMIDLTTTGTVTGSVIDITADSATTGKGINISMDGLTTGSILDLSTSGVVTGNVVNIVADSTAEGVGLSMSMDGLTSGKMIDLTTTGTVTGSIIDVTADSATTGKGINISMDALTTGEAISITTTSTGHTGNLVSLVTDDTSATGTSLYIKNDSSTGTTRGLTIANNSATVFGVDVEGALYLGSHASAPSSTTNKIYANTNGVYWGDAGIATIGKAIAMSIVFG